MTQCAHEAIKKFLDIDNFTLHQANAACTKAYDTLYKEFKKKIIFPKQYLDMMYNSKYAQHFYTKKELQKFRAQWESNDKSK